MSEKVKVVSGGGCLGSVLAFVVSYALNHSVLWAIVHMCFSWFYILYALVTRSHEIIPAVKAMFA